VIRGGSFYFRAKGLRSAFHYADRPGNRVDDLGFRLARSVDRVL
jgi:formylglycine-generating enzyme required for sulfatase activity